LGCTPDSQSNTHQALKCQVCGLDNLESVLDLGYQPLCNGFSPVSEANRPQVFHPLCLYYCPQCSLVQLGYVLPTRETFGEQYTYLTGSSRSLVDFYDKMAAAFVARFDLGPGDIVVEIGSNDGTFLKSLQSHGLNVLGVEGAERASEVAIEAGIPTLPYFFGKGTSSDVRQHLPPEAEIRLIIAMNVLAHTDNIHDFLPEVAALMGPNTVFASSSHWLIELIRQFAFDTIYHEHLRYYTLNSLMKLFERHGLYITDAEETDFYGGSILGYASRNPESQSSNLKSLMREERQMDVVQSLRAMKLVMLGNKTRLLNLLYELKSTGKRVVGIGAPMKSSTLLNYYGITPDLVEYLAEVNPLKVGTLAPGVGIPVVDEEIFFKEPPDYALLLSWNMAEYIMPKYREMGYKGKFILPVPEPKVIE